MGDHRAKRQIYPGSPHGTASNPVPGPDGFFNLDLLQPSPGSGEASVFIAGKD